MIFSKLKKKKAPEQPQWGKGKGKWEVGGRVGKSKG
jgi:hypothetical protein